MIRRRIIAAVSGLAALALAPQPLAAQDPAATNAAQMTEVMDMVAQIFQAEPLTPEQEARLPAAGALTATMLPEGFYAAMMGEMMDGMLAPMMGMFGGEGGALLVLQSRLGVDPEVLDQVPTEQRIELATLLDPGFVQRGDVMNEMMRGVMAEAAVTIEPLFREGLTKAYAARFDAAQLADIGAFFATPTGGLYASESMKLMADPQVMGASMQALPAMLASMGDITAKLEAKMAALPPEKSWADLTTAERARLAEVLSIPMDELEDSVFDPAPDVSEGY